MSIADIEKTFDELLTSVRELEAQLVTHGELLSAIADRILADPTGAISTDGLGTADEVREAFKFAVVFCGMLVRLGKLQARVTAAAASAESDQA